MKNIYILITVLLLVSCKTEIKKPQTYQLFLVETSDVHGAIFKYDFINNGESESSLSQVSKYVTDLRKNNPVVLMDNGDILQGQPVVYYSNYMDTVNNHITSKTMNFMNYDAATVGNHDIEAGHKVYDKLKTEFDFPWLAANAVDKSTGKPYFDPYVILNRDGIKIAVLGLITPGIPDWLPEELWSGIEFEDMVESAKKWVPQILEKEKPDLLVGLFHSGYDYSYGNVGYNTHKNENASFIVAEQVPGFDVIFVGHDHKTWNKKVKNVKGDEVLIMGPTSAARQVAQVKVDFKLNPKDNQYDKQIEGEVIVISEYEVDTLFENEFDEEFNEIKEYVSAKVGEFEQTVYTQEALFGPSRFIDLIQEIQLDISNAEISFAAPLSFNAVIDKGPVYVNDMFKLYRFENFLYTMSLTGKEIDDYLEYSFGNWYSTMDDASDHLLNFKLNDKGEPQYSERYNSYELKTNYYNFDVAAGINYTVDVTQPYNEKVNIISMQNGSQFSEDSTYLVAINSYRGNGGGGHLTEGAGLTKQEILERRVHSTDKDLRFYMMKWIENKGTVNPTFRNEWEVIPHDWWKKAKQKDKEFLNN